MANLSAAELQQKHNSLEGMRLKFLSQTCWPTSIVVLHDGGDVQEPLTHSPACWKMSLGSRRLLHRSMGMVHSTTRKARFHPLQSARHRARSRLQASPSPHPGAPVRALSERPPRSSRNRFTVRILLWTRSNWLADRMAE